MPTGQVEKNSQTGRALRADTLRTDTLCPDAAGPLVVRQGRSGRRADLDDLVGELARRLLSQEVGDRDTALASGLEALGLGLSADRASFYLPTQGPGRFEAIAHWDRSDRTRTASADSISIDLGSLPGRGSKLLQGETLKLGGAESFPTGESAADVRLMTAGSTAGFAAWSTAWSLARTSLYVPCVGPGGLLGFFRVEGGLAASRWSEALIAKATLVGCLVANFLERHALAAELDATRLRQCQDERLETLGRVASSVAHDFNNVLTAILGYADLLEMEMSEKSSGRLELTEIRDAATRAADLVEQVLSFGRCRKSGTESIDLAEILSKLEGMLRRVVGEDTRVEIRLAKGLDPIRVDPGRLERVILNLASNAREALSSRSASKEPLWAGHFELDVRSVTIDAKGRDSTDENDPPRLVPGLRPGRYVRLTARDNGCGVDPATQERIFEPFFTTKGTGTGLGLATVAEVLREARGTARIESTLGSGTSFHLYFPV